MLLGCVAFVAVWLIGWAFGAPRHRRLVAMAALWLCAVGVLLILPGGRLAQALGGDVRVWLVAGGLVAAVVAYRAGLGWLKSHARPVQPQDRAMFSTAELTRYSRHLLMRDIGGPGQQRLKSARVLVVGAGGLGSPICLYLAAAGVGEIGIVDGDRVESSNLQRQIIHKDAAIGLPKVQSAAAAMRALNPFITVKTYEQRLEEGGAAALIGGHDLVLDGTDNFDTRDLLNKACTGLSVPLISGAISQWEGQISLFDPARGTPCYHCVFPQRPAPGMVPACAEAGVAAPLPGVIGAMMAMEAVKHLVGAGETLAGRLLIHDALHMETRMIMVKRRPHCPVCAAENSVSR